MLTQCPGSPWWRAVNERCCSTAAKRSRCSSTTAERPRRRRLICGCRLPTTPRLGPGIRLTTRASSTDISIIAPCLQLSRVLPDEYPRTATVESYLSDELGFGRLLDYGVIVPRLQALYEWSAQQLGAPGLL